MNINSPLIRTLTGLRSAASQALAAATLALAGSGSAHATFTVYTSQSAFLAAVAASGQSARVDRFDDLAATNLPSPLLRQAGDIGYQVSAGSGFGSTPGLRGLAGSGADHWLSTLNNGAGMALNNFSAPVYAVGAFFFVTDDAGAVLPNIATIFGVTDNLGAFGSSSPVNPNAGSFVGIVSTRPLTSASFGLSSVTHATINDLLLASAVPEAGSAALWLAGLAWLAVVGGVARRRVRPGSD